MTHPEFQAQVDLLLDGELSPADRQVLDAHLAACPSCTNFRVQRLALRSALRREAPALTASDTLRARVRGASRTGARPAIAPWWGAAAIAASLAVAALGGWRAGVRREAGERLAAEILASHVRALMPGHLTDVLSSDQHTVKPWFNGKLDFSPAVSDFAGAGYPLLGGRLDYVNGRAVAALAYGRRQHVVDVFIWPEPDATAPVEDTRQGYHLVHWTVAGFSYWMASDLGMAELRTLAQLIRQSDSAAATAAR